VEVRGYDEGAILTARLAQAASDAEDEAGVMGDGRRLRAARNRDAVVAAVLEILRDQDGGPVPGAAEVAERAGVSERTVFRHFADLDSMFIAASNVQRPILVRYLAPRPDMPELDKRIAAVVRLRSKLYEEVGPIRRVVVQLVDRNEILTGMVAEIGKASRAQAAAVFAPELERAGRGSSHLLDELDLILSWASWEHLRRFQGCGPDRARRIITDLLTAILAPHAAGRRKRS
jgi:AcrR family transcriptional regulator